MSCDLWGLVTPGSEPGDDPIGRRRIFSDLNSRGSNSYTDRDKSTDSIGMKCGTAGSSTYRCRRRLTEECRELWIPRRRTSSWVLVARIGDDRAGQPT